MVASDFGGLGGYGTLQYEGWVPTKTYKYCLIEFSWLNSVCIATYGMSVPSLHAECTDSVIDSALPFPTLEGSSAGSGA